MAKTLPPTARACGRTDGPAPGAGALLFQPLREVFRMDCKTFSALPLIFVAGAGTLLVNGADMMGMGGSE